VISSTLCIFSYLLNLSRKAPGDRISINYANGFLRKINVSPSPVWYCEAVGMFIEDVMTFTRDEEFVISSLTEIFTTLQTQVCTTGTRRFPARHLDKIVNHSTIR